MKREMSAAARAAKEIRQYLKEKRIAARVTSKNYSMGDNVNVYLTNQPPEVVKKIKDDCNKYQKGHFNGMEDIYEYSNSRDDVPQTKFLFINNELTDGIKQSAWNYLRRHFSGFDELPENLGDVPPSTRIQNSWHTDFIWRLLNGSLDEMSVQFWAKQV